MVSSMLEAFLEGFTGGSVFTPAILPGAPTRLFADDSSEYLQHDLLTTMLELQDAEDAENERQRTVIEQAVQDLKENPVDAPSYAAAVEEFQAIESDEMAVRLAMLRSLQFILFNTPGVPFYNAVASARLVARDEAQLSLTRHHNYLRDSAHLTDK